MLVSALAAAGWLLISSPAAAGPMPIARRTAGILASDSTLGVVYLVRDLNADNDANDPGEVSTFLDATNAAGLGAITGSAVALFQTCDGTVYVCDTATDSVYAARDVNGDGDANDAGEVRPWFTAANASGLTLPSPNGACQGADGAIYITNAGTSSLPQDALYRTVDLNKDGDANDAGEGTIFVDETLIGVLSATPFECAMVGSKVHFIDIRGSNPDVILVANDADGNGSVSAAELGTFFTAGGALVPAATGFTCQSDGVSVYSHASTASVVQTVWRLTDLDASGTIDQANEGAEIWSENNLPAGFTMNNSFSFALGPGRIAISSNGVGDVNDELILAIDTDGNGVYNDAGGTVILKQGDAAVSFPETIRTLLFYGTPCLADVNNSCDVSVQDIFDFLACYFVNSPYADINASGSVTVQDIFDFLQLYFTGC
jgi:hypothetical protein